jgi:hypothetical protein
MSKGNTFENDLLLLIFNNVGISGIADALGVAGSLYVSLHTADPGETGAQNTSEITYSSYTRVAVARSGAGWVVTGNSVSPAAAVVFPAGTGGSGTATHFGVGTASSGAGKLLYKGAIATSPAGGIVCGNGVTPRLTTATVITED